MHFRNPYREMNVVRDVPLDFMEVGVGRCLEKSVFRDLLKKHKLAQDSDRKRKYFRSWLEKNSS